MIMFIQYANSERHHFKITNTDDLHPIFEMFPNTKDIAMASETLKDAVDNIVEYISGHNMSAWVEDGELSKTLKNKALALGISLSTAMSPTASLYQAPPQKPTLVHSVAKEQKPKDTFGLHPMDKFLWNVKQIESSGGKNTQHPEITHGQFKGTRAIGRWGLLKPTVTDILSRMKMKGNLPDGFEKLEPMSRNQLETFFKKNPEVELHLARALATHVHSRQKGDLSRSAYAWLHGHNLHPGDIHNDKLLNSDYVSKYKRFDKINPFNKKQPKTVVLKSEVKIDSSDFKEKVKSWLERRESYLTDSPMRSSNYQADLGRKREDELDEIIPSSQMTPEEKLKNNLKIANKG